MKNSVLDRLETYFNGYFPDATKPTARNLFLIVVSILALDIFRSVRSAHRHVLSKLSDASLNAYYYALKTDKLDHRTWRDMTMSKALKTVPDRLDAQPLFLSIDDTMIEKKGEKFELRSKFFDHAAHNGSNYLDGHCMVSILLSFPVLAGSSIRYMSVPLGYQLWDKKQTKLEIAADMVCAMPWALSIRTSRCSCFVTAGIQKDVLQGLWMSIITLISYAILGLTLSCTIFLPGRTGRCGRPRKYGERLSPEDIIFASPETGTWRIGVRPVLTRLWGGRVVYAIVTLPKSGNGSRRLFFCIKDPEDIAFDYGRCADDVIRGYGKEDIRYLPLACYMLRWDIETSYYENKTFWSLEGYRMRSREGIERLVNLECMAYSAMTLLPYNDG